ncbi:MAG: DUF424 family protein [Thermoplasmata archaeon]|nr:DUF424 family protein [Thermoplasmata archaeon]
MKVYRQSGEVVVAACDAELLGETFEEGEMILKVTSFYDGFACSEEELVVNLRAATSANLVGKKVIKAAVKAGFIDEGCVIKIGGVPHAQLYMI